MRGAWYRKREREKEKKKGKDKRQISLTLDCLCCFHAELGWNVGLALSQQALHEVGDVTASNGDVLDAAPNHVAVSLSKVYERGCGVRNSFEECYLSNK